MSPEPDTTSKLSLENILHIVVCLGLFAVFVIFCLWPAFVRYGLARDRVARTELTLGENSALLPFQIELMSELGQTPDDALKAIELTPLRKEDFTAIQERFEEMSQGHGLNLQKVALRIHSSPSEHRYLGVLLRANGAFTDMRPFLLEIFQMPSFFHLERLKISEGSDQEDLEAQIWLSVL